MHGPLEMDDEEHATLTLILLHLITLDQSTIDISEECFAAEGIDLGLSAGHSQ